jgi:hypothetical protein
MCGGIGMVCALGFLGNADVTSWIYFRGPLQTAPGKVTSVDQTSASEGGSEHHSGTPIYRYDYQFTVAGVAYQGTSFQAGISAKSGDKLTVEYPAANPARSRIQGMRRAVFGPGPIFALVFPIVGFGLVAAITYGGWKNVQLLVHGETAMARFINKEKTNQEINERAVFKLWYEFADINGVRQRIFIKSSAPETLETEASLGLFYDAAKPGTTLWMADLPAQTRPDERGQINACTGWTIFLALLPIFVALMFGMVGVLIMHAIG